MNTRSTRSSHKRSSSSSSFSSLRNPTRAKRSKSLHATSMGNSISNKDSSDATEYHIRSRLRSHSRSSVDDEHAEQKESSVIIDRQPELNDNSDDMDDNLSVHTEETIGGRYPKRRRLPTVNFLNTTSDTHANWISAGHVYVGKRVRRYFRNSGKIDGVVTSWLPASSHRDPEDKRLGHLFHVKHEDGDSEDLDERECQRAIMNFGRRVEWSERDCVDGEEEENFNGHAEQNDVSDDETSESESSEIESSEEEFRKYKYSLRDRSQTKRTEFFNPAATDKPNLSHSAKRGLSLYKHYKSRRNSRSKSTRRRKSPKRKKKKRKYRRRPAVRRPRKHFDSSSESSSDAFDGYQSDERLIGAGGGGGGMSMGPTDFGRYEEKREMEMLNKIKPINQNPGFHDAIFDKATRRDISRADANPIAVDPNATLENSIGGLDSHLQQLKEMVLLPLLYPEFFSKFNITPPRGVLFHGPPGTGKTLVARALCNVYRQGGSNRNVSFFMRKGADCLSKWVGEAERQLRLLFLQAQRMAPSIIFFDEIDGLAPVRSAKQDQIHASIVSTLLALMDGIDARGQVVVIGATNRIDSIDPALRRPGRFDREFAFPLPSRSSRLAIIGIHTKTWNPPLNDATKQELADLTEGYCGADIKALCAEASLSALRRTFPQVYKSQEKLKLDLDNLKVGRHDLAEALHRIVPASKRSAAEAMNSTGVRIRQPLPPHLIPIYHKTFDNLLEYILHHRIFNSLELKASIGKKAEERNETVSKLLKRKEANRIEFDEKDQLELASLHQKKGDGSVAGSLLNEHKRLTVNSVLERMVHTESTLGTGQQTHFLNVYSPDDCSAHYLCEAFLSLQSMEGVTVKIIDPPSLSVSTVNQNSHSLSDAIIKIIAQSKAHSPCVLYLRRAHEWLSLASDYDASNPDDDSVFSNDMDYENVEKRRLGKAIRMGIQAHLEHSHQILVLASWCNHKKQKLKTQPLLFQYSSHISCDHFHIDEVKDLHNRILAPLSEFVLDLPPQFKMDTIKERKEWRRRQRSLKLRKLRPLEKAPLPLHNITNLGHIAQSIPANSAPASMAASMNPTPMLGPVNGLTAPPALSLNPAANPILSMSKAALAKKKSQDHDLRELRIFLRKCLHDIKKERRYHHFIYPVDPKLAPDYYDVIEQPMCLEMMEERLMMEDDEENPEMPPYMTFKEFLADIKLISFNAKEYNPVEQDPTRKVDRKDCNIGRKIRSAAVQMVDQVKSYAHHFEENIKYDLFDKCERIARDRKLEALAAGKAVIPWPPKINNEKAFKVGLPVNVQKQMTEKEASERKRAERRAKLKEGVKCPCCGKSTMKGDCDQSQVVICDGCDREYHFKCVGYTKKNPPPRGKWFCELCHLGVTKVAPEEDVSEAEMMNLSINDDDFATGSATATGNVTTDDDDDSESEDENSEGEQIDCPICKKSLDPDKVAQCRACKQKFNFKCVGIKTYNCANSVTGFTAPDYNKDTWICPGCKDSGVKIDKLLELEAAAKRAKEEQKMQEDERKTMYRCKVCSKSTAPGAWDQDKVIICDDCGAEFRWRCAGFTGDKEPNPGNWYCKACSKNCTSLEDDEVQEVREPSRKRARSTSDPRSELQRLIHDANESEIILTCMRKDYDQYMVEKYDDYVKKKDLHLKKFKEMLTKKAKMLEKRRVPLSKLEAMFLKIKSFIQEPHNFTEINKGIVIQKTAKFIDQLLK